MDSNKEIELLERTAEGDQIAFAELFDSYHHSLGAFIYGITKSKQLAEEITQDVFVKIWMARETLAEVTNFKAYLFTISRNSAISSLRKIINERTRHTQYIRELVREEEGYGKQKEVYLSLIDEAINQLSTQRKKIYLLSREQGLKYEEIASQLGLSRFTVRAHIQQAVESIVKYVKRRIDAPVILFWFILNFLIKK